MNHGKRIAFCNSSYVLIDTWWNVNKICIISYVIKGFVLIDTWWNVNKILAIKSHKILTVLIDTWWNVNSCTVKTVLTLSSF